MRTAVETNLLHPWQRIRRMPTLVDILIFDIEASAEALPRRWVGMSSAQVPENARRLAGAQTDIMVRTPIIPGANDTREEIGAMCDLSKSFPNMIHYELLSFSPLGVEKYRWLGKECVLAGKRRQCPDELMPLAREAISRGIRTRVDGAAVG